MPMSSIIKKMGFKLVPEKESSEEDFKQADERRNKAIEHLQGMADRTDVPAKKKLYGLMAVSGNEFSTTIEVKQKSREITKFVNHAARHDAEFNDDDRRLIRGRIIQFLWPESLFSKELATPQVTIAMARHFAKETLTYLGHETNQSLFKLIHLHDLVDRLNDRSQLACMPIKMRHAYKSWTKKNRSWINDLNKKSQNVTPDAADEIADAEPAIPEEVIQQPAGEESAGVIYVDVKHALVDTSDSDNMGFIEFSEEPKGEPKALDERIDLGRRQTLVSALLADPMPGQALKVFRDLRVPPLDAVLPPYDLIDMQQDDVTTARIAVPRWKGFSTFVIRDPQPLQQHEMIRVGELREDPKVWTARYMNDTQWTDKIQELLRTPLDKLEPELKHRSYWHGKKQVLTESFIATIIHTGTLPSSGDRRAIAHGPLAGNTTFSRAYGALQNEHVKGLEGIRTFNQLYRSLQTQLPALAEFLNRRPVQASEVFNDCSGFIREYDLPPVPEFYDDFKIDNRSPNAVELAFQAGAVEGVAELVPPGKPSPRNLRDFVVAVGLVRIEQGQMVPAVKRDYVGGDLNHP